MGAGTVQVCTAAMHYGFRIVEDMIDGLSNWMDDKGFKTIDDFRGLSLPRSGGVEESRSELQDRRAHSSGEVHRLRALLHGLLGWRASVHSSGSGTANGHRTPAEVEAESSRRIASTPIAKLDGAIGERTLCHAARAHSTRG